MDQFKAEYDAEMKKEVKLNQAEAAAKKSSQEAEVRALEAKAATSAEFLSELKAEIAWTQHWEANAEEVAKGSYKSWNQFKLDHYYPNYKVLHTHTHTYCNIHTPYTIHNTFRRVVPLCGSFRRSCVAMQCNAMRCVAVVMRCDAV